MVDSILFPWSGRTILTTVNGETVPVSGAQLEVFDAGTTNQQTVYLDSALTTPAANPVEADSAGVVPLRFLGTDAYKITFEDSNDTPLSQYPTWDNVPGATDTSGFLTGSVSPTRPVTNVATTTTLLEANDGQHINADATGGSFTVTLRSAVSMGNGNDVVVKHSGSANTVTVSATQTIDGKSSFLLNPGDAATFRSDGGNFSISEAYSFTSGIVTITYAAAVTPDLSFPTDTDFQITLTGALTINAPTSLRAGQRGTFTLIQDATGGHVTTWNSAFNQTGGFNLDTAANAINKINFHVRETGEIDLWIGNQVTVNIRTEIERQESISGSEVLFDNIPNTFFYLELQFFDVSSSAVYQLRLQTSDDNGTTFHNTAGHAQGSDNGASTFNGTAFVTTGVSLHVTNDSAGGISTGSIEFPDYANENSAVKIFRGHLGSDGAAGPSGEVFGAAIDSAGPTDAIRLTPSAGTFDGGTVVLYGWS
jgi:hypothetical protein